MVSIKVHPRVTERHPNIQPEDVLAAWNNCLRHAPRLDSAFEEQVAIGIDNKGRAVEMIGVLQADGAWLIYHAMTPPTNKVEKELKLR